MTLHDLLDYGKPHTGAVVFASFMQSLEDHENPIQVPGFDSDTVVLDGKDPFIFIFHCGHMDLRRLISAKFNGILNQILKYLQQLGVICRDRGKRIVSDYSSSFGYGGLSNSSRPDPVLCSQSIRSGGFPFVATREYANKSRMRAFIRNGASTA